MVGSKTIGPCGLNFRARAVAMKRDGSCWQPSSLCFATVPMAFAANVARTRIRKRQLSRCFVRVLMRDQLRRIALSARPHKTLATFG